MFLAQVVDPHSPLELDFNFQSHHRSKEYVERYVNFQTHSPFEHDEAGTVVLDVGRMRFIEVKS